LMALPECHWLGLRPLPVVVLKTSTTVYSYNMSHHYRIYFWNIEEYLSISSWRSG
jgi:hypothetical protein